jgi:farnesyl-diphosphate farnesyltransferase
VVEDKALPVSDESDLAFCERSLVAVSRTFSEPIRLLPDHLRVGLMTGYLLCRIADTVEDLPGIAPHERSELFQLLLDVLHRRQAPHVFAARFEGRGDAAEIELAARLATVMRVFDDLEANMRASGVRWVSEMIHGMRLYTERPAREDGIVALHTLEDLDRYCYFVAGTVGHLVTDLFVSEASDATESEVRLRRNAEAFGIGLQLVNILKDVTDDRERGWSFVPVSLCTEQGFDVSELCEPSVRVQAHRALAPMFDLARSHLDRALEYTLSIDVRCAELRQFCLLPLWMAVRTLVLARGNDAVFDKTRSVKITRLEVAELIADCLGHVSDDAALRQRYAELWNTPPELIA